MYIDAGVSDGQETYLDAARNDRGRSGEDGDLWCCCAATERWAVANNICSTCLTPRYRWKSGDEPGCATATHASLLPPRQRSDLKKDEWTGGCRQDLGRKIRRYAGCFLVEPPGLAFYQAISQVGNVVCLAWCLPKAQNMRCEFWNA